MPQIFPMNWIFLSTNLMLSITSLMLFLYFISVNWNSKFSNKLKEKKQF